jgi:hypothetical protein
MRGVLLRVERKEEFFFEGLISNDWIKQFPLVWCKMTGKIQKKIDICNICNTIR